MAGWGILGVGAIVSFIIGGLVLFGGTTPTMPSSSVSLWLLGSIAGAMALTLFYVVRVIFQSRAGWERTHEAVPDWYVGHSHRRVGSSRSDSGGKRDLDSD